MKKHLSLFSITLILVAFTSCISTPSASTKATETKKESQPPRREFESVDTTGLTFSNMFVVNNGFVGNGKKYNKATVKLSAGMLAFELGIQDEITDADFAKIGELFFNNLPAENEVKEIVIPQLCKKENATEENEMDGYFFIYPSTNKNGKLNYTIETNLPIASIWGSTYDGYIVTLKSSFFKNQIPARWNAMMSIEVLDDTIVYNGVAYPNKASPLQFTGTGIGSDTRLSNLTKGEKSLNTLMTELDSVVKEGLEKTPTDTDQAKQSMNLLSKYNDASMSMYSYLAGNPAKAKEYLAASDALEMELPENVMGGRCKKISEFMNWILKK